MITPRAPLSRTVTRKIAPAVSRSVSRRRLPPITSLARRWPSMIRSRTSRRRADTFATVIRCRWTVLTSQRRCNRQTRHASRMGIDEGDADLERVRLTLDVNHFRGCETNGNGRLTLGFGHQGQLSYPASSKVGWQLQGAFPMIDGDPRAIDPRRRPLWTCHLRW